MIAAIVDELAPELIKRNAIGYESASQLLITAGDNPQRLRSESGFAALCGVSPVPVSSGKRTVTDLIVVEIVLQIVHFTSSPSDAYELTQKQRNMSPGV
jgi:transposase